MSHAAWRAGAPHARRGADLPVQAVARGAPAGERRRDQEDQPMTQRILMLLPEAEAGLLQAANLAEHDALSVAFIGGPSDISASTLTRYSLLLVWVEGAQPSHLPMILQAARSVCTVLAVTRDTLLDAIDVLGYFDAVLFADQPIARQVAALEVALDGYILLPDYIDSRFTPDTVRAALAQWLTPRERHLLDVLATGATNRAISEMLGTTEANVKGLVRSVLKKLHLRNRTEAALFAVRNRPT